MYFFYLFNYFLNFQGIKDFYERLSEEETELLLNASKQFSGHSETTEESNGEWIEAVLQ